MNEYQRTMATVAALRKQFTPPPLASGTDAAPRQLPPRQAAPGYVSGAPVGPTAPTAPTPIPATWQPSPTKTTKRSF
jgi:hypothetical protein